jgi:hypothetical protein
MAGEGQKILMIAIPALHPGKAVVQVAAVQIPVNDLLEIGAVESVLKNPGQVSVLCLHFYLDMQPNLPYTSAAEKRVLIKQIVAYRAAHVIEYVIQYEDKKIATSTKFKISFPLTQ